MDDLLNNKMWDVTTPSKLRLVRIFEFPNEINPFAKDGVIIKIAAAPGEAPYHKYPMARAGILDGIKKGYIKKDTIIVEATSGNTGHAMATICNMLGLKMVVVISRDIPGSKIDIIRALGNVSVRIPEHGETTAECARRLGAQGGWYNPDQYSGEWNPRSHYENLAPQIFNQTPVSIFVAPGGTMGTCISIAQYARDNGFSTKVVPVMSAEGQEIPATRTLSRVKKDVRLPWQEYFDEEKDIEFGTRLASFLLSYLSWRVIPVQLGPSFGLGFVGALKFLRKHKEAGTLDQFRGSDGMIHTVIFGPDDYRPYNALYLAMRLYDNDYAKSVPDDLLSLIDLS